MKIVWNVLHYFSIVNTFLLCMIIVYFSIKYTIGLILKVLIKDIYCEIIYLLSSIFIVKKCCKISSPYKKYIS